MIKKRNALALLLGAFAMIACSFVSCSMGDDDDDDTPSYTLTADSTTIAPKGTATLTYKVDGKAVDSANVTWESDDSTVASVDAGTVTGVAVGSATIKGTYNTHAATLKITVEDISLPISVTMTSSFVGDEFGTLTPSQSKDITGVNSTTYKSWDTASSEVRTSTGMYVYAEASGLIKVPATTEGLVTYYYGAGAAVGSTVSQKKSYLAFSATQLKTSKLSVKLVVKAHGVQIDPLSTGVTDVTTKYGTLGILDADGKVLAKSAQLTATSTEYTFYVKPTTKLIIKNIGGDGTNISFDKITAEESDEAITATGTVAATSVTLASTNTSNGALALTAGNSETVTATLVPSDTTETSVTWSSGTTSVATVTVDASNPLKAVIAAKAEGTSVIKAVAADSSVYGEITVTVSAANNPISSLTISASTLTLDLAGDSSKSDSSIYATIVATDTSKTCDTTSVVWSVPSDYADYLAVETTNATTSSAGIVSITGTLPDGISQDVVLTATAGSKTATCTVTVKDSTMLFNDLVDWSSIADTQTTVATLDDLTFYAQNNGFQGDCFNYYCVSGLNVGKTVSSTIKSYVSIPSACMTSGSYTSVELVVNAKAISGSTKIAVLNADTLKVIAVSDVLSSTEYADYTFNIAADQNIKLITTSTNSSASWYLNSITGKKSDTAAGYIAVTGITGTDTATALALTVDDADTGTKQLTATIEPTTASDQNIIWSSSKTEFATVSDGLVTAVAAGDITITATSEDGAYTATWSGTVSAPATGSLTVTKTANADGTATLTAAIVAGTKVTDDATVLWSVDNYATLSATSGASIVVTGSSAGTATVSASAGTLDAVTTSVTVAASKDIVTTWTKAVSSGSIVKYSDLLIDATSGGVSAQTSQAQIKQGTVVYIPVVDTSGSISIATYATTFPCKMGEAATEEGTTANSSKVVEFDFVSTDVTTFSSSNTLTLTDTTVITSGTYIKIVSNTDGATGNNDYVKTPIKVTRASGSYYAY